MWDFIKGLIFVILFVVVIHYLALYLVTKGPGYVVYFNGLKMESVTIEVQSYTPIGARWHRIVDKDGNVIYLQNVQHYESYK